MGQEREHVVGALNYRRAGELVCHAAGLLGLTMSPGTLRLKGDSYRLKDRDLGRVTPTED